MRTSSRAVMVALLVAVPGALFAAGASELLMRAQYADKQVSYRGIKIATVQFGSGATTATLKVVHRKPDQTRTEYFAPAALAGVIFIQDGDSSWRYHPRERIWEAFPRVSAAPDVIRQVVMQNYELRLLGTDEVAGRPAHVIHALPRQRGEAARRIWVDKEVYLVVRTQVETTRGSILNSSRYTEIDINPDDISPSAFAVSGKVKRPSRCAASKFATAKPAYLPRGYRMVGVGSMSVNSHRCIHMQFSNGVNTISLFQRPANARGPAVSTSGRLVRSISWAKDGMIYTLMGNVPQGELKKIADSMR